ncbi:MAG: hypothetical protein FWC81_03440 [Coriobacteriia bacterium]|nr:hypothetical protein [Coriobacteriia bacterium]MCL2606082.1 hypothetical protein [Coriobacteriia bacterium]
MLEIFENPFVVGGASAAIIFYLITTAMQAVGIFKLCSKIGYSTQKRIALTAFVIIPFGIEISLLIIAYDKGRKIIKKNGSDIEEISASQS